MKAKTDIGQSVEAILLVIVIGVGAFLAYRHFNSDLRNPETFARDEVEVAWIETKRRVLQTDPYKDEAAYQRHYWRARHLLGLVIERHRHFLDNVEVDPRWYGQVGLALNKERGQIGEPAEVKVKSSIALEGLDSEVIFFLGFVSWNGAMLSQYGHVSKNVWLMNRAIEYLINERHFAPALFLKGLVFKYGINIADRPKIVEARALLEQASQRGVGSALLELDKISLHASLLEVRSVHMSAEPWYEGDELRRAEIAREGWR